MTTPRLLDQVRDAIRVRHYSRRTEDTYVHWIRRFILFHAKRHPREMGEREITAFLTFLAVKKNVAASTQNQALSALLFLYQKVLEMPVEWLDDVVRARRPKRLPVVLSRDEVARWLNALSGIPQLVAQLMFGTGMHLMEALRLPIVNGAGSTCSRRERSRPRGANGAAPPRSWRPMVFPALTLK
jgi:integrase